MEVNLVWCFAPAAPPAKIVDNGVRPRIVSYLNILVGHALLFHVGEECVTNQQNICVFVFARVSADFANKLSNFKFMNLLWRLNM